MLRAAEKAVEEHPFLSKLLDNSKPVLQRTIKKLSERNKRTGKIRIGEKSEPLSQYEEYDVSVFRALSAMTNAVSTAKNALRFIVYFPRPRTYEKTGVTQNVWIEYHFSYYTITFVSFVDIALILTNAVFQLGLREKDCKPDTIKNNSWIRGTSVKKALSNLEKIVKPYREPRNLHVHRGHTPKMDEFCNSELYDKLRFISSTKVLNGNFWSKGDRQFLEAVFNIEIKKIIAAIENDFERLLKATAYLFDELYKKYEERSKLLHELFN